MFPNDAHAFGGFKANPPLETDEFEACAVQRWEVGRTFTANNYAKSVAKDMDQKLRRTFTAQTYAESVAKDMDEKLRDKIKEEFAAKDMDEKLCDKKKKEFEAPPLSVNDEIMELFCCKVWGLCHKKTALQGSTEENPNEEWKKYWFRSLRKLPKAMGTALDNWFRTIKKNQERELFFAERFKCMLPHDKPGHPQFPSDNKLGLCRPQAEKANKLSNYIMQTWESFRQNGSTILSLVPLVIPGTGINAHSAIVVALTFALELARKWKKEKSTETKCHNALFSGWTQAIFAMSTHQRNWSVTGTAGKIRPLPRSTKNKRNTEKSRSV